MTERPSRVAGGGGDCHPAGTLFSPEFAGSGKWKARARTT
jgi:hypothetical protein